MSEKASPTTTAVSDPIWPQVLEKIRTELSEQSFRAWFEPLLCQDLTDQHVTLVVPDKFFGDWLKEHYQEIIRAAFISVTGKKPSIKYSTAQKLPSVVSPLSNLRRATASASGPVNETGLNDRYTFDNFVVGPGSRFSHAAALAVSESPGRAYNPLFIHGPVGLGKTHLLQGIAHHALRLHPNLKVLYMSGERFTNLLIGAIQNRSTESFRQRFRTLDLLLVDDVHFLAGKESTQEEFFHTFNALYDAHKQMVVASDRPPRDIPQLEERLVSRFGWGLVTDIQPPDLETRIAILKKKVEAQPNNSIPDDVLFFIANRVKSNIRELEGALVRVTAFCSLTSSPVTLRVAEEVLKETVSEEAHKISIDLIQRKVSDYFGLKPSDLRAKKRSKSIAHPRQLAMFLVRELTSYSLPEIGEYFGGRDHATVLHAWKKVKTGMEKDARLQQTLQEIRQNLQND